jgi:hypothetical protein
VLFRERNRLPLVDEPFETVCYLALQPKPPAEPARMSNANYLLRPLQVLNLNEPIRVAQLKLPVAA